MNKWRNIIERVLEESAAEEAGHPVALPPVTSSDIETFESQIGKRLPDDMRDLYRTANGFGMSNSEDGAPDYVKPLHLIYAYAKQECEHYGETHPEFADSYLPFVDLGNGDSIGYYWGDPTDSSTAILVLVAHEDYQYDSEQDVAEFVREMPSLHETLGPG